MTPALSATTTYSYDVRGNRISATNGADTTTYSYDALDRLISVSLPTGMTAGYRYDADGRRVESLLGGQVARYLWDEASTYGDVVLETNGDGEMLASYVLGGMSLISQTREDETRYYTQDALGSTRALTDASGSLTDSYSYTAFGDLFAQTGSTANSYLFTGQQHDAATGLYSMRARYYDPAVGRFLTQDIYPVDYSNPLELNRYVYVANNPVNATDPSGLQLASTAQLNAYTVATAGALVALYFAFCPFCQQQLWQAIDELLVDRIEDAFQNLLETLSGRRHEVHSGTETRTETRADEEDDEVWRVRHYSIDIVAIMSGGVIKSRGGIPSLTVYVEYPPEMPRTAEILEARHFHFTLRRNQLSGVVEFDVDLSKWTVTEDPSFAGERRAWIIHIPVEIWHRGAGGFPLTPDINPEFYNANGNRIG